MLSLTLAQRFWQHVHKQEICWIWTGKVDKHGIGDFRYNYAYKSSRRTSYELHIGPLPEHAAVYVTCDQKRCVNPNHLSVRILKPRQAIPRQRFPSFQGACEQCGTSIKVRPHRIGVGKDRFCSKLCWITHKNHKNNSPENFWKHVCISESNECWIWQGTFLVKGYGVCTVEGKQVRAHRRSYELSFGEIPEGLIICHKCDNPKCVNPNHLFAGTHVDNAHDRDAKGRGKFPRTKVTTK